MFQVTNLLTFQSFTVDSRDELLSELEVMAAKHQPLAPSDSLELRHVDDNGEIIDQTLLDIPFTGTIDQVLENFGHSPSKVTEPFWQRLNPFKRKGKASHNQLSEPVQLNEPLPQHLLQEQEDNLQEVTTEPYNLPLKPETTHQEPANDGMLDLLNQTRQVDDISEVSEANIQTSPLPEPAAELPEATSEHHQPVKKDSLTEYVAKPVEPLTPVSDNQSPALIGQAEPRGVDSLSTYDLQLEFVGRVKTEVDNIDQAILDLTNQINRLTAQKQTHLKLLEAIDTLTLT